MTWHDFYLPQTKNVVHLFTFLFLTQLISFAYLVYDTCHIMGKLFEFWFVK